MNNFCVNKKNYDNNNVLEKSYEVGIKNHYSNSNHS